MLNYKHPATKRVVVAICLVAAVSLAVLSNPTAIYAAAEPIVTAPSVIVNSSPSLILATQTPPSAPMTEEQTGTDKLPEDATVNLTLKWPVDGGYVAAGMYSYRGHTGMDIAALHGTEIYAAGSGTVVYASNKNVWPYGRHVIIDHGDGYQTLYAHCSEVLVEPDTEVVQGELIAKVGRTGNASGNHCHIEVRLNGEELDPKDFIEIPSK